MHSGKTPIHVKRFKKNREIGQPWWRLSLIIGILERRSRSGGAPQGSGPRTPFIKSSKRSQRKSGSDLPNIFPEIWLKTPHAALVRKAIVWKIGAHAVEVSAVHTLPRSPRVSFILGKENRALLSRSLLRIPSKLVASLVPPPALQSCTLRMLNLTPGRESWTPETWKCRRKLTDHTVGCRASALPQPPLLAADPSLALRDLKTFLESHLLCVRS
ncbi:CDCA5 [Lemmus lemmus]